MPSLKPRCWVTVTVKMWCAPKVVNSSKHLATILLSENQRSIHRRTVIFHVVVRFRSFRMWSCVRNGKLRRHRAGINSEKRKLNSETECGRTGKNSFRLAEILNISVGNTESDIFMTGCVARKTKLVLSWCMTRCEEQNLRHVWKLYTSWEVWWFWEDVERGLVQKEIYAI